MTIFGLNSPELFVLLAITLIILGTKRIEKGLDLFSRLLKFLLSNQSNFDKIEKGKESIKEIEETKTKEKITKAEEKTNAKEKESIKEIEETKAKEKITKTQEKTNAKEKKTIKEIEETKAKEKITKTKEKTSAKEKQSKEEIGKTQDKEDKSEKILKIANVNNKEDISKNLKDSKVIVNDKTVEKLKTKNPEIIVKDKKVIKSNKIKKQEDPLEK